MGGKKKNWLVRFFNSKFGLPVIAAIGAGLYPVFFYYSNNYTLINTWQHLGYFVLYFLVLPVIGFSLVNWISNLKFATKWRKYILPFLNIFLFLFFIKVALYAGIQKKILLGIFVIAVLVAYFLHKHFKKIVILQFILALIGAINLTPTVIKQINYSTDWMIQPDNIEEVVFSSTPNIYFIQPDGYVNHTELNRGYYKMDNSEMDSLLARTGFTRYPDFRSNYASTLASNSATFMMKHHYYNRGTSFSEAINARNVVITDNSTLRILKNNGYRTYFFPEMPYMLLNRPKMGFDVCNFSYDDIAYIGTGLGERQDIIQPLIEGINEPIDSPKFFFLEIFNPGHIHNRQANSLGMEGERELWMESLDQANNILERAINSILENDPNAMIIIMADHGGFVGFDYTKQIYNKTEDRDQIYSIFSSELAIRWPNGEAPELGAELKTAVNLFRVLFAHLGGKEQFLEHLQDDGSYLILHKGAPKGIYQYLDSDGAVRIKKM